MPNEVIRTILKRSSIRAYTDEPVTREALELLKKAALASPTAMNRQNQRFYFVTDREKIEAFDEMILAAYQQEGDPEALKRILARGTSILYHPPLLVLIMADRSARFGDVDAGIAVQNIALAAESLGLSSVIIGRARMAFEGSLGAQARALFGIPEGSDFMIALCVGHKAVDKAPHTWDESHVVEI